ncbi:uncharacterized protein LOC117389652 [Periophthalmus magnuspinnatus]|uniref:uncharacterized protein LOC117389652 n=1 Tax=Periophthalmus magnuspinnatus TaxID=409849 RepID=UPI00145A1571|nr:uncharacterized protein LOC117389652 [Periophthalmus magnuspinnatus]
MLSNEKMESVLTFKRISVEDSGLYACRELNYGSIGHTIKVNVSETNQRGKDHPKNSPEDQNVPSEDDMKMTALVYFISFLSIAVLLLTITVITLLRLYVCKSRPRRQPKTHEERPSHLRPGLPKKSPPVLRQASCIVSNISSSVIEEPPNNSERAIGSQVLTGSSAAESLTSGVYSKIDRTKSKKSFQHHASTEVTCEMSVISVVSSEL